MEYSYKQEDLAQKRTRGKFMLLLVASDSPWQHVPQILKEIKQPSVQEQNWHSNCSFVKDIELYFLGLVSPTEEDGCLGPSPFQGSLPDRFSLRSVI